MTQSVEGLNWTEMISWPKSLHVVWKGKAQLLSKSYQRPELTLITFRVSNKTEILKLTIWRASCAAYRWWLGRLVFSSEQNTVKQSTPYFLTLTTGQRVEFFLKKQGAQTLSWLTLETYKWQLCESYQVISCVSASSPNFFTQTHTHAKSLFHSKAAVAQGLPFRRWPQSDLQIALINHNTFILLEGTRRANAQLTNV